MDDKYFTILLQIRADCSATKQAVEDLAGPQGRVTKLENAAARQWWYTAVVALCTPFLALAHAVARHFGVNV